MSAKLRLAILSGGLGLAVVAHAADPLICNITQCAAFSPAAISVPGAGAKLDNWARNEIWSITEEILQVVGLQPNFELVETTQVGNAAALIHNGKRILAYNPDWTKRIERSARWPMYGLVAHEIGHHLQGHTLLPGGSKPPTELEADSYAGFVLAKLGAAEHEAISLWETLPERGSATHPGRAERLAVVRQGWARGRGQRPPPVTPPAQQPTAAFVIADSSTRLLASREIAGLSPAMLRLARNEIFARHGYVFDSEDLRSYFGSRTWYVPRGRNVTLSGVEKANVDLIRAQESANGGEVVERGVIFPQSSAQVLSREEVVKLSPAQRRIARNEIFARRGYIFNDPQLSAHFGRLGWYKPQARAVELNAVEEYNVRLIRSLE